MFSSRADLGDITATVTGLSFEQVLKAMLSVLHPELEKSEVQIGSCYEKPWCWLFLLLSNSTLVTSLITFEATSKLISFIRFCLILILTFSFSRFFLLYCLFMSNYILCFILAILVLLLDWMLADASINFNLFRFKVCFEDFIELLLDFFIFI